MDGDLRGRFRVDHYQGTVQADGPEVLEWLLQAVPESPFLHLGRDGSIKRLMYDHAVPVLDGTSTIAVCRWGGNGGGTNVELKGSIANETFGFMRAKWPVHSMTRGDVAVDGTAPGLFDATFSAFEQIRVAIPANKRPDLDQRGDWMSPAGDRRSGRSAYYGKKESGLQVVLYEKGWEREARGGLVDQDHDWTRVELRVYPKDRPSKELLAQTDPFCFWGLSKWAAAFCNSFAGLSPLPVKLPVRTRDHDRTFMALLSQYGNFLRENPNYLEALPSQLVALEQVKRGTFRSA